jgi:hypothetical protein
MSKNVADLIVVAIVLGIILAFGCWQPGPNADPSHCYDVTDPRDPNCPVPLAPKTPVIPLPPYCGPNATADDCLADAGTLDAGSPDKNPGGGDTPEPDAGDNKDAGQSGGVQNDCQSDYVAAFAACKEAVHDCAPRCIDATDRCENRDYGAPDCLADAQRCDAICDNQDDVCLARALDGFRDCLANKVKGCGYHDGDGDRDDDDGDHGHDAER